MYPILMVKGNSSIPERFWDYRVCINEVQEQDLRKLGYIKFSNELESRTALIVFTDKAQMDLIGELFSIRESCSGTSYITNIELLENIAREVRDGSMHVKDGRVNVTPEYVSNILNPTVIDKQYVSDVHDVAEFYEETAVISEETWEKVKPTEKCEKVSSIFARRREL